MRSPSDRPTCIALLRQLRFYVGSCCTVYRRTDLTAGFLSIWLLEFFCPLLVSVSGAIGAGVALQMYQLELSTHAWFSSAF